MILRQVCAKLKEREKEVSSQKNNFNVAKIILISPVLFSEHINHFTTTEFHLRKINTLWKTSMNWFEYLILYMQLIINL